MPKPEVPSEIILQSSRRLRAAQLALGLRNADMARLLNVGVNTYSNWIGSEPKRRISELAMLRLWQHARIPMEFIYGGDISRTDYELAQKLIAAAAEVGAVIGAPAAEFPMQTEHIGRAPARAPRRQRGPLHEPQPDYVPPSRRHS
jgi:transcriptional regulator with XRE-family HTH domain